MIKIDKSIEQGFGPGGLYDILKQLQNGMLPISGETYFVSKYGNNTDGLSWETAFTTIAAAIAASNTHIAITENANGRNRIYIDGGLDGTTHWWAETLTTFPSYCDMIGVGQAGDLGTPVMIYGATAVTGNVFGCHVYNLAFYGSGSGVPVVRFVNTVNGLEFHNCIFRNKSGNDASIGLQLNVAMHFTVSNCKFLGYPSPVIGIQLDTSVMFGEISNNFITAVTTGINIAAAVTTHDYQVLIKDNVICKAAPIGTAQLVTGIAILDPTCGSHAMIVHNYISAADAIAYTNADQYSIHRDHWMCVGNYIVEANVATMETVIVDG